MEVENRENPIFGRKVFFVNPPMGFDVSVIKKLREMEYEVYVIPDYKYVKSIMRSNENALCFINIDGMLSVKEWYNFIKSFKLEEKLSSIFIGVVSGYASTGERGKFLINLQLQGGFIQTSQAPEDIVKQFSGILSINGAKGRRQYIRLHTKERKDIHGYMAVGTNLFSFNVENISVVGFACTYNIKEIGNFEKNTVLKDLSLTIVKKSILCPCFVFETRVVDGMGFSILLFTKEFPTANKPVIQNYIFNVLDEDFRNIIKLSMPDYTDYTVDIKLDNLEEFEVSEDAPPPKIGDVEIPKPDDKKDDADAEDIEEVEEVEEVEEAETVEEAKEAPAENPNGGFDDVSDIEQI